MELSYLSATELAALVRARTVSPVEVVQASLERIEAVQPALNCFCFLYPDEALEHAKRLENATTKNLVLPGIPVAIKDLTPIAGKRTTRGSYSYDHWISDHTAVIVERLRAAGAIVIGKTT